MTAALGMFYAIISYLRRLGECVNVRKIASLIFPKTASRTIGLAIKVNHEVT